MMDEHTVRETYRLAVKDYQTYIKSACLSGLREGENCYNVAFDYFLMAKKAHDKMKVLEEILKG